MIGIALIIFASLFYEISSVIGRKKILKHQESIYTFGFLQMIWALLFILILLFVRESFVFSAASLPTLALRIVLEMAQIYSSLHALRYASRSTIGFLMTLTIPLLLMVDIAMGYEISTYQILGIIVLTVALFILSSGGGIDKKGIHYVLFSAINATATLSLYKYNITNFNSPEVEQGIVLIALLLFLFIMANFKKENPFVYIFKKGFFIHSFVHGLGVICSTFAVSLIVPSIYVALKRVFAILISIVSGKLYFHEKHLTLKITSFVCIALGIALFTL